MKKSLFFSILLLLFANCLFAQKNSLLWEVSGNGLKHSSYLFGTYHVLPEGYLKEVPKVNEKFAAAENVVVEMVIDSSKLMELAMITMMPDNSLTELYDSAEYATVKKYFKENLGVEIAMFNQVKPSAIAVMLAMQAAPVAEVTSKYEGLPMDLYFATEGKKKGKNIVGLETMEEQMKILFDHEPLEKQADELLEMIEEKDDVVKSAADITDAYLTHNLDSMWEINKSYIEEHDELDYLIDDRNKAWIEKLPDVISAGPSFIAVGALHLPGENGVIELLRKEGFTVKAVK